MDTSEKTQKCWMRKLGAVASMQDRAPSSDDRDVGLKRGIYMDKGEKLSKE